MATKKITLSELRNIVKQMVKEEMVLKEDYLELKSIGKLLYSFLKRKGYDVEIKENSSKSKFRGGDHLIGQQYGNTKGGTIEIHQFSDVEEVGVFIPVYALTYQFIINPDNHKYIESLVSQNRSEVVGQNYGLSDPEKYWTHVKNYAFGKSGKIANSSDIMRDPGIQKAIGSLGVELQNLIKSKYPNMQFIFKDDDVFYSMYFAEPKTAKGAVVNPNQRPNAPRPQAQQEPIAESLKLRNFFK